MDHVYDINISANAGYKMYKFYLQLWGTNDWEKNKQWNYMNSMIVND